MIAIFRCFAIIILTIRKRGGVIMYKYIIAGVMLSISQLSFANDAVSVWSCVDSSKLEVEAACMMNVLDVKTNDNFYTKLEQKSFEPQTDAFAIVTLFPQENLIVVKSLENQTTVETSSIDNEAVLLVSNNFSIR